MKFPRSLTGRYLSGELSIPVHHSLMTRTGTMNGITTICAHSQALAQCQVWLTQNYPNIERVAVASNGEAARMAAEDPAIAAVASEIAGQKYNLQVVKAHIQDDPHNRTRFAIVTHPERHPQPRASAISHTSSPAQRRWRTTTFPSRARVSRSPT